MVYRRSVVMGIWSCIVIDVIHSGWYSSMCVMHARAAPYCSFQSGLRWAGEGVINPSLSASTLQRALLLTHNYVRFQRAAPAAPRARSPARTRGWLVPRGPPLLFGTLPHFVPAPRKKPGLHRVAPAPRRESCVHAPGPRHPAGAGWHRAMMKCGV